MAKQQFEVLIEHDREAGQWVTYVPALDYASTNGINRAEALEYTVDLIQITYKVRANSGRPHRHNPVRQVPPFARGATEKVLLDVELP